MGQNVNVIIWFGRIAGGRRITLPADFGKGVPWGNVRTITNDMLWKVA